MMRRAVLGAFLLLIHCRSAPGSLQVAPPDPEKESLRQKLAAAHVRILKLELERARAAGKPEDELRLLIEAGLASEFSEVRAAALLELGALPEERRKAAAPEVLRRFLSASEPLRIQAIAFLGRVPTPEAEAAVLQSASDPSPAVRAAAASALRASPREEAVRTLLGLLKDPSAEVRIAAVDALGAAKRQTVVIPLTEFLAGERDEAVLEKAADALGSLGSPSAVEALLGLLRRTSREAVRWSCINSLGKIGDGRASGALRPYLEPAHPPSIRGIAAEALGKMKDRASLEPILQILRRESEEKLRLQAAVALGRIAPPGEIDRLLLPPYAEEKSPEVRRALWDSMKELTGADFDLNERLIRALASRGMIAEAAETCLRLHAADPGAAVLARAVELEQLVGDAARGAGDPKTALPHHRRALSLAPDRDEIRRKVLDCYRELKDPDGALKALRETGARLPKNEASWWSCKMDLLDLLKARSDAEGLVLEIHEMRGPNPAPLPEDRRKALDPLFREAALHLVQALEEKDEAARKSAQEAVRRCGRALAAWLAAELDSAEGTARPALHEAAAAILGSPQDPSKPRETAAALRAWLTRSTGP